MLWNQKGTDTGSLLFARMAASYIPRMASYIPRMAACIRSLGGLYSLAWGASANWRLLKFLNEQRLLQVLLNPIVTRAAAVDDQVIGDFFQ